MLCSGVFLWARITEGGLVLLAGKPPEHQLDHADLHLRLARRGLPLVIPAVDPTTTQPGKCPLHHPTPLDHSEALAPGGATLDLDRVPAVLGDPSVQLMVVVLVVRPELLQPRERLLRQPPEHLRGRGPVIRRGAGDGHRQKQPERVHHDVPLATVEPLAAVVTVGAADLGSPDRLAVDAAGAGSRLPPRLVTDLRSQGIVDRLPSAIGRPSNEVVVDGPPAWEVAWQSPPDAAVAVPVEDRVDHLSKVGFAGPPAGVGGRKVGLEDRPPGVSQVAGIGVGAHPLSTCEFELWNRLLVLQR